MAEGGLPKACETEVYMSGLGPSGWRGNNEHITVYPPVIEDNGKNQEFEPESKKLGLILNFLPKPPWLEESIGDAYETFVRRKLSCKIYVVNLQSEWKGIQPFICLILKVVNFVLKLLVFFHILSNSFWAILVPNTFLVLDLAYSTFLLLREVAAKFYKWIKPHLSCFRNDHIP